MFFLLFGKHKRLCTEYIEMYLMNLIDGINVKCKEKLVNYYEISYVKSL